MSTESTALYPAETDHVITMTNYAYFRASPQHPAHLSVGAVLQNDRQKIAAHHFVGPFPDGDAFDVYILMRETVEIGESLEEAVARGLKEEFGAVGRIRDYLGSIRCDVPRATFTMHKTTLYFLADLLSFDISQRDVLDPESGSTIEWHEVDFLIAKMQDQSSKWNRSDLDESEILRQLPL